MRKTSKAQHEARPWRRLVIEPADRANGQAVLARGAFDGGVRHSAVQISNQMPSLVGRLHNDVVADLLFELVDESIPRLAIDQPGSTNMRSIMSLPHELR